MSPTNKRSKMMKERQAKKKEEAVASLDSENDVIEQSNSRATSAYSLSYNNIDSTDSDSDEDDEESDQDNENDDKVENAVEQ
jgi:hypothetical protein